MQAFGYVRGNLPGQKGPDASEQRAEIEAYCKEKGLELFSIIEDDAEQSWSFLTSRIKGCLLQVIPDNSHLVFPTYSVMCRNHYDWRRQMEAFLGRGHVIHILEWCVSTDSPSWPAVLNIVRSIHNKRNELGLVGLRRSRETSALTLATLGIKGFWPRNRKAPAGFKIRSSKKQDRRGRHYFILMKDEAQREQMKKVVEMIDEHGMMGEDVAMILNRANIRNIRTGHVWVSQSVWSCYRDFKGLEAKDRQLARYIRPEEYRFPIKPPPSANGTGA